MSTPRCPATWSSPLGRHRCCLIAGHDGSHARSRFPDNTPTPASREITPMSNADVTAMLRAGRRGE